MACTLAQKQVNLCASGIGNLTDPIQLLQVTVQVWCNAVLSPVDPYNNRLVYVQVGGAVTIIENPSGGFDLSAIVPKVTEVHSHNSGLKALQIINDASLTVVDLVNLPLNTLVLTNCTSLPALNLSSFTALTTLNIAGCTSLATLTLTNLKTITNFAAGVSGLTSVNLPALTTCLGSFDCNNSAALTLVSAPLLTTVTTNLNLSSIGSSSAGTSIVFTGLQTVGNFLLLNNSTKLGSISFPALTSIGALAYFQICAMLTSVSCPLLASCGDLHIENNPVLTSVNFNSLQSVAIINASGDVLLVSFLLPAYSLAVDGWDFSSCTLLANFSFNNQPLVDGLVLNMPDCALTQASVDMVLAAGVAGAITADTIELSGGTSSAPSVAGQANKALLVLAGVVVNTN